MFKFPENLYTDVRIEDVFETKIQFTLGSLEESKNTKYRAAFIRVFDGERWYYASTSDVDNIQNEIDKLSKMAKPNEKVYENPIVQKLQANTGEYLRYKDVSVSDIEKSDKVNLLKQFFPVISSRDTIKTWQAYYADSRKIYEFYSSKGANLVFDSQRAGFSFRPSFSEGEKKLQESFQRCSNYYSELNPNPDELKAYIDKCEDFLKNSKSIEPGKYTVILSPVVAGVFAHESFGHKSESDFMVGDETMKREWAIGKKIGSDILSIVDSGLENGNGYVPFDDEGTRASKTYLIENGILKGRLHSASTAAELKEDVTGNARAKDYEYEPIVRMTSTYVLPGDKTKEELFAEVKDGVYIETFKHGSGMSTFTIAPSMAYRIRDGKIAEPINFAVITGTVFDTLSQIDGLSDKLEIFSSITGGCGKMEQYPLPVGFGGPYVRIKNMNVQ